MSQRPKAHHRARTNINERNGSEGFATTRRSMIDERSCFRREESNAISAYIPMTFDRHATQDRAPSFCANRREISEIA